MPPITKYFSSSCRRVYANISPRSTEIWMQNRFRLVYYFKSSTRLVQAFAMVYNYVKNRCNRECIYVMRDAILATLVYPKMSQSNVIYSYDLFLN